MFNTCSHIREHTGLPNVLYLCKTHIKITYVKYMGIFTYISHYFIIGRYFNWGCEVVATIERTIKMRMYSKNKHQSQPLLKRISTIEIIVSIHYLVEMHWNSRKALVIYWELQDVLLRVLRCYGKLPRAVFLKLQPIKKPKIKSTKISEPLFQIILFKHNMFEYFVLCNINTNTHSFI